MTPSEKLSEYLNILPFIVSPDKLCIVFWTVNKPNGWNIISYIDSSNNDYEILTNISRVAKKELGRINLRLCLWV
jgi:hypothetical protein